MTHQPINLNSIDFSKPDGEFTFRGQSYQIKRYLNKYFFKNQKHKDVNFIYSFQYDETIFEEIFQQKYSPQEGEEIIENEFCFVQRCVQYESAIFCFRIYVDGAMIEGTGEYFSHKYTYWRTFYWKPFRHIRTDNILYLPDELFLDNILYLPYELFFDKARTAYCKDLPKIEDQELRGLFGFGTKEATTPLEFVCGSESELKRLTQLAAVTLPELKPLFEHYSGFEVIYQSENDYHFGGVTEIITGKSNKVILSRQAQQLFNLIFEYNFFSGLDWEYNDGFSNKYSGYDPRPYTIRIEVQAASQHERLEAALELQTWLLGKIPEDEMQSYLAE